MQRICSLTQFAGLMGVSSAAVRKAVQKDRIEYDRKVINGSQIVEIDLTTEGPKFLSSSPSKKKIKDVIKEFDDGNAVREADRESKRTVKPKRSKGNGEPEPELNLNEVNLRKASFQAKTAELEYNLKAGLTINIEEYRHELEGIGIKFQKTILAIPSRIAQLIAAETDPFKCGQLLTRELNDALTNLSHDLKRIDP